MWCTSPSGICWASAIVILSYLMLDYEGSRQLGYSISIMPVAKEPA